MLYCVALTIDPAGIQHAGLTVNIVFPPEFVASIVCIIVYGGTTVPAVLELTTIPAINAG